MRTKAISASLTVLVLASSFTIARAKDTFVGQLGCDVTHRPKDMQKKDLEITCVFNPQNLKSHDYYMGSYTVRANVPKQAAGVMHWEVFTSKPESFKGLSGTYALNQALSRSGRPPAFAVLSGGRKNEITLRPYVGHFNHERNFAGHIATLDLLWGG